VVLGVLLRSIRLDRRRVAVLVVGPPGSTKVHFRQEDTRHHLRHRCRRDSDPTAAVHCRGVARDVEEVLLVRHMIREDCQAIDGVGPRRGLPQPPWFQKNL
jgi:hypothetical protein